MTDEQLAARAAEGDELAFRRLRDRHRGLIFGIAARRFAPGISRDDFDQEAHVAFWKAVVDFKPSLGVPFGAFATLVVTRHVDTALKTALRLKHRPVSAALSLDAPMPGADDGDSPLSDVVPARSPSPHDQLVQKHDVAAIASALARMSPLERESAIGRANGESYLDTEARLSIANDGRPKKVDNALQRARIKIADALGVERFPLGAAA